MDERQETVADISAWARGLVKPGETLENTYELLNGLADRIEAAQKREVVFEISAIRAKLYGVAAGLHALAARSDARQRGISYTVAQDIAKQIENIADEGGKE